MDNSDCYDHLFINYMVSKRLLATVHDIQNNSTPHDSFGMHGLM